MATSRFTLDDFALMLLGVQEIHPTGSKYICDPPVLTTDEDYYGLAPNKETTISNLLEDGWTLCTENEYEDDAFTALRKGVYNLILLFTQEEYWTHVQTTNLAKRLNLTNKKDRVDLFELVRNGHY